MAKTTLADVIVPSVFTDYVVKETAEKSALIQSGIVVRDSEFDRLASETGPLVTMPYWSDLGGASEVMTEAQLDVDKIEAKSDVAAIIRRAKRWGATGLAAALAGDDPMKAIGDQVAGFWARDTQKKLIKILNGALGATASNTHDVTAVTGAANQKFNKDTFIGAQEKLGDSADQLTAVAMHSAVYFALKRANEIDTNEDSGFNYYDGKFVIIDDGCPVSAGNYTSFLFGAGAVGYGVGSPIGILPTEVYRVSDTGSGEEYLVNRKTFILHPRGIAFTGNLNAKSGPTDAELESTDSWTRAYEAKQVRIVAFKHKI